MTCSSPHQADDLHGVSNHQSAEEVIALAIKVDNSPDAASEKSWGDVDKTALGNELADGYAAGDVSEAVIREVYAFVPDDAFGEDADGNKQFYQSKAWGPHHELVGDTVVINRDGMAKAAAAAAGARAEPSLSDAALGAVKKHLRRHYSALDLEPPEGIAESQGFKERVVIPPGYSNVFLERDSKGTRYLTAWGLTAEIVNANGRLYTLSSMREAVQEAQTHLHESPGQGALVILGEPEHPSDKLQRPRFLETIVKWEEIGIDESKMRTKIRGRIIETDLGRDAITIMEAGVMPAISQRAYGESHRRDDGVEVVDKYTITGFDLLAPGQQSDPNSFAFLLEHREQIPGRQTTFEERWTMDPKKKDKGEGTGDPPETDVTVNLSELSLAQLVTLRPDLVEGAHDLRTEEARQQQLAEERAKAEEEDKKRAFLEKHDKEIRLALGLGETDDVPTALEARDRRLKELEEREQQQKVEAYIVKEVGALEYPDWMRKQFLEAVKTAAPKTVDEAKALIIERRKEYDALAAQMKMIAMGHRSAGEVLGPVLERDTGHPSFAVVSVQLNEAMARRNLVAPFSMLEPRNANQRFAVRVMERFDELYKGALITEARRWEEAEQTSDLNLPYSVSRAVLMAAMPTLVATGIFDVDTIDASPTRVYYESWAGETGYEVTITDEDVVTDDDAWVAMAHKRIVPGTVNAEPNGGGTAFTEGSDYVIDYEDGKFWTVAAADGGTITSGNTLDVDYHYYATREGEMSVIQRAKHSLSYVTIDALADRLSTQISQEALVFARASIGWDPVARALDGLAKELAKNVDQGIMYAALSGALITAANIVATWTNGTNTLDELVQDIGLAKVTVANNWYEPTFILLSGTNSDRVSNWDGFTAAGARADGQLNPNGMVGRLKGLDVFESTQFSDGYALVGNRELAMHRLLRPMTLQGPIPTFDVSGGTSKLVAASQWFAEMFSDTVCPVSTKGAVVKIA